MTQSQLFALCAALVSMKDSLLMVTDIQTLWVTPDMCCYIQVTRAVFEASKGRLKVVGRAGVGIDNVDLQAATEVAWLTCIQTLRCCAQLAFLRIHHCSML